MACDSRAGQEAEAGTEGPRSEVFGGVCGCGSSHSLSVPLLPLSHRPVCGVAGIPSSQSGAQHHGQHPAGSAAPLPHCSHAGSAGSALAYRTQMDTSPAILMPSSLQTPQTQEQNGILDWLRKLRLHKYYPVFKQLSMEKVCRLPGWPYRLFSQDLSGGIEFPKPTQGGRSREAEAHRLFLQGTVSRLRRGCLQLQPNRTCCKQTAFLGASRPAQTRCSA